MTGKDKLYIKKYEALDFGAGTYNSRILQKRDRYHQRDFLDYLSTMEVPSDMELVELLGNELEGGWGTAEYECGA